jgi:hypothetical protein
MAEYKIPKEVTEKMQKGETLLPPDADKNIQIENIPPEIKEALDNAGIQYQGGGISLIQQGSIPPDIERIIHPRNPDYRGQGQAKTETEVALESPPYVEDVIPEAKKPPLSEANILELPINPGDEDEYYFSLLDDTPYKEELKFCNNRFFVGVRTRSLEEIDVIVSKVNKDQLDINMQVDMAFSKYHLCYAIYG